MQFLARRRNHIKEAMVTEILHRKKDTFTGKLRVDRDIAFLVTQEALFVHDILVPKKRLKGGKTGDRAVVRITQWPDAEHKNLVGEVVDVLGPAGDNDVEMNAILVQYGLPYQYPKRVEQAAEKIQPGTTGDETGRAFRDIDLEEKLLKEAHKIGLGAQFGGKYLAHDIRVIRLPRHGASCPIGMGVSCSADRNIKAKINADGIWLEKMDENPTELIPEELRNPGEGGEGIVIDLDKGIDAVRAELTKYPVSTRVSLNGTIIVARDIAHAKLKAALDKGEELPQYFKDHPILYAGPAKTPEGFPCGSMGPTTANRMDPYVDEFQAHGASLVMIAKGNRTDMVTEACKKHGGFYLGTIGGVAAVLSKECITSIDCVAYPELGMEAIWKITVKDFPAFILVDDKGHDFFKELKPCKCQG